MTRRGDLSAIKLLLEAKADVHRVDADGNTPVQIASLNGDWDIFATLAAVDGSGVSIEGRAWSFKYFSRGILSQEYIRRTLREGAFSVLASVGTVREEIGAMADSVFDEARILILNILPIDYVSQNVVLGYLYEV